MFVVPVSLAVSLKSVQALETERVVETDNEVVLVGDVGADGAHLAAEGVQDVLVEGNGATLHLVHDRGHGAFEVGSGLGQFLKRQDLDQFFALVVLDMHEEVLLQLVVVPLQQAVLAVEEVDGQLAVEFNDLVVHGHAFVIRTRGAIIV